MTPILASKAKEIWISIFEYWVDKNPEGLAPEIFDKWLRTKQAAALLSGDWKEDGMPLPELIEEMWDKYSQLIGSDIDDLDYWAGREAMKAIDFEKVVNEIVDKLKPTSGLK